MNILLTAEHELRAPLRVLFFVIVYYSAKLVALIVGSAVAPAVGATGSRAASRLFYALLLLAATAAATEAAARVTENRSIADVGFAPRAGWWRDALVGLAAGCGLIAVAVLPLAAVSAAAGTGELRAPAASIALAAVFFAVAAATEELLCRGFALQTLARAYGPAPAAVVTSAAFAALHVGNPGVSPLALATTFAAGLLLSVAYFRAGNLWMPTGLHFGWNFAMGYLLGLPISGLRYFPDAAIVAWSPPGPAWLTGDAYGPEGGVLALGATVVGCLLLARVPTEADATGERASVPRLAPTR